MTQISARLPQQLVEKIDRAAIELNRSRAQIVRQALEYYLEDVEDLRLAVERLNDPADVVLDWEEVKRGLLDQDQGQRRKSTTSHRPARPRASDRRHRSTRP